MINYDKFKKSLEHLEQQYNNYSKINERKNLLPIDKEAIQESVIQRFETCYDTLWKQLKKYMEHDLGLVEIPNSPKPIFRLAYENKIFENIDDWINYANARIGTSHDYSEDKAKYALECMKNFINDAIQLYEKITGDTWSAQNQ